ncbi:FlgN protein [Polystyrenella longa]|uniref:FlgN protein n=1 Tax=Polystyrenella longa TaxID=2528007 RepID=A0A518CIQ1_9PLAN|nr:hypothetical protein [Polystyrenella longa]QDU79108.1 FlgN protein [Polystyrenella longa]
MSTRKSMNYHSFFKHRYEHCRILLALSEEQNQAIVENRLDDLLSIIGRKQRVLKLMEDEKRQHPELWEHWQSDRETFDANSREQCEQLLSDTETVMASLVQLEQQGTSQLQKNRDETQQQLHLVSQSMQANDAYSDQTDEKTHRYLNVGR